MIHKKVFQKKMITSVIPLQQLQETEKCVTLTKQAQLVFSPFTHTETMRNVTSLAFCMVILVMGMAHSL